MSPKSPKKPAIKTVDEYIKAQKPDQQKILQKLRKIILKTFPKIEEEMMYGVPCYEDKYYLASLKNQVNLGFSIAGMSDEEISLFEGTGKTTRHRKIRSLQDIDEKEIVKLLKVVKKPVHGR